jgi:glycosyltransferase involved in cell wall biosynthesis
MISVIIPTLWKGQELPKLLEDITAHDKIGEVIIIDNDRKSRPNIRILSQKKIKFLRQTENIYVNPAWNLGAAEAKNQRLCFVSDDTQFDVRVFDAVYDMITKNNGVIGVNSRAIKHFYVKSALVYAKPVYDLSDAWDGFGTLMFVHKKNYLPIPEELKIYWGDTWLWDYNAVQGRQNYTLDKFCLKTKMRTSSSLFKDIIQNEEEIYLNMFKKMYEENKVEGKELSCLMAEKVYNLIKEYA